MKIFTPLSFFERHVTLIAMNTNTITSNADEWRQWMAQAQSGDAAAYTKVLTALNKWLVRYFSRRAPLGAVDDLVQETLVAIHRKRHTYLPEQPLLPWVAAIARYKWIDGLRKLERSGEVELPETLVAEGSSDSSAHAAGLMRLLAQLPPAQATAIRLTKLEGRSVEEASAQTGQSVSLVKVNVHRGLKKLQDLIARMDDKMEGDTI